MREDCMQVLIPVDGSSDIMLEILDSRRRPKNQSGPSLYKISSTNRFYKLA